MKVSITLKVNGREYPLLVKPNEILLNVLRDRLGLMGTKYGCGLGECGACTVLKNGQAVLACQTLAFTVDGQDLTTIEGLEEKRSLHPLQEAFIAAGAVQCGYCTPGMIMSAKALLDRSPDPSKEEIKEAIRGNLCRCTGYTNIVHAIKMGSQAIRKR
ncbi:MAG: (2Fe-2S)-binding protein [Spirochaetota bacterium]